MCPPAWRGSKWDETCKRAGETVRAGLHKARRYRGQPHRVAPTNSVGAAVSHSLLSQSTVSHRGLICHVKKLFLLYASCVCFGTFFIVVGDGGCHKRIVVILR